MSRFALLLVLLLSACATPRADRDWLPYLSRTAEVEVGAQGFTVSPLSDWRYDANGPVAQNYGAGEFAFEDLRNVWFVLEPQPGSKLAAHTFLMFEFEGDRLLGLTIEARRERHESYSAIRGVWNTYELAYLWASARDLLTRRAVFLKHDVYIYPVAISDAQKRMLLTRVLERTQRLQTEPRFYNTLGANCTNELAKAAGLRWNPAFVLTGTSDDFLFSEGLIPGESFEAAKARAHKTELIKALHAEDPADFDAALLAHLR
jgi:hypothetical protein